MIAAYAVGSFPTAQVVGRRIGRDPTAEGSRNPGASNVYRLAGRRAGAIVLVVDALKGFVPVLIALLVVGRPEAFAVWVAAVAGHVWPVTRSFRGGKGVATAGGGVIALDPLAAALCVVVFVVTIKLSRTAALGSLAMAVFLPLFMLVQGRPGWEVAVTVIVAVAVVVRHRTNLLELAGRGRSAP